MNINFSWFSIHKQICMDNHQVNEKPNKIVVCTYILQYIVQSSLLAKAICIMQKGIAIHIIQLLTVDMENKKQHKISYLNINYIYRMCKEHFIYVIKTEVTEMDQLANVHRSHIWEGNTNTSITQFPLPDDKRSQIHEESGQDYLLKCMYSVSISVTKHTGFKTWPLSSRLSQSTVLIEAETRQQTSTCPLQNVLKCCKNTYTCQLFRGVYTVLCRSLRQRSTAENTELNQAIKCHKSRL